MTKKPMTSLEFRLRSRIGSIKGDIARKIAWRLPRLVVLWVGNRLLAHATTGMWKNDHPSDVTVFDALERWTEGR